MVSVLVPVLLPQLQNKTDCWGTIFNYAFGCVLCVSLDYDFDEILKFFFTNYNLDILL